MGWYFWEERIVWNPRFLGILRGPKLILLSTRKMDSERQTCAQRSYGVEERSEDEHIYYAQNL